jgi:hypothetical protein
LIIGQRRSGVDDPLDVLGNPSLMILWPILLIRGRRCGRGHAASPPFRTIGFSSPSSQIDPDKPRAEPIGGELPGRDAPEDCVTVDVVTASSLLDGAQLSDVW